MATTPAEAGRDLTRWFWPCAMLLIASFLGLAFLGVYQQDPTTDEPMYFGVGKDLIEGGGWGLRGAALHPPLSFYVSSLPLLLAEAASSNRARRLLMCRLTSLTVFALPLLFAILLWARELYGRAAALVALALAAFSPTLLAHAPLITPDLPLTATGFITMYLFWRSGPGVRAALPWGIALGLTLLAKASALLFVAAIVLSAVLGAWRSRDPRRIHGLISGLLAALFVLNLGYGFRGALMSPGKAELVARLPVPLPVGVAPVVTALFPKPYIRALSNQLDVGVQGSPAFLMGEVSQTGWWYYFLIAFMIKETLPFLALLAASVAFARWTRARWWDELLLLIPPALFFIFFSVGQVQIGMRYLLPAYPFLFVSASKVARLSPRAPSAAVAVFGLLVWHALSAVRISPDYLAYFNELVGGPRNGYLYLGDSNLDWGQNRSRAKAYAREHGLPINPEPPPEKGGVVVRADRIQGRVHGGMYRLLREEYTPVRQLGYNWLIYELERGQRFPRGLVVPVFSGPTWLANARRDPGGPAAIGWTPARVAADPEEEFQPAREYPGTQAVLMQCPGSASECRFLHSFMLERSAAQAILHFASRDRYEIHVNGQPVARRSQCAPEFVEERRPVTRHLQPGLNEVAIWTGACEMVLHGVFVEMRVIQAAP